MKPLVLTPIIREFQISEYLFFVLMALMVGLCFLFLPVNPWPVDGWFGTRTLLFRKNIGIDNYTPVSVPAYWFRSIEEVCLAMGFGIKFQMYLSAFLNYVIAFFSFVFVYNTIRLSQSQLISMIITGYWLIFILSKGLAMTFYSENISLMMISILTYLCVKTFSDPTYGIFESNKDYWIFAFVLGFATTTRVIPILLLPVLFIAFIKIIPVHVLVKKLVGFGAVSAVIIFFTVLQNGVIFDRYELTSSSGRHLWQGVSPLLHQDINKSSEAIELETHLGDIAGKNWWEVRELHLGVYPTSTDLEFEAVIKDVSVQIIRDNFGQYILLGIKKLVKTVGKGGWHLGYDRGLDNPLKRETMLPPPVQSVGLFSASALVDSLGMTSVKITHSIHAIWSRLYLIVIVSILVSSLWVAFCSTPKPENTTTKGLQIVLFLVCSIVSISAVCHIPDVYNWKGIWQPWVNDVHGFKHRLIGFTVGVVFAVSLAFGTKRNKGFLTTGFLTGNAKSVMLFGFAWFFGSMYASWQLETNNTRNYLPYIPVLAVLTGYVLQLIIDCFKVTYQTTTTSNIQSVD